MATEHENNVLETIPKEVDSIENVTDQRTDQLLVTDQRTDQSVLATLTSLTNEDRLALFTRFGYSPPGTRGEVEASASTPLDSGATGTAAYSSSTTHSSAATEETLLTANERLDLQASAEEDRNVNPWRDVRHEAIERVRRIIDDLPLCDVGSIHSWMVTATNRLRDDDMAARIQQHPQYDSIVESSITSKLSPEVREMAALEPVDIDPNAAASVERRFVEANLVGRGIGEDLTRFKRKLIWALTNTGELTTAAKRAQTELAALRPKASESLASYCVRWLTWHASFPVIVTGRALPDEWQLADAFVERMASLLGPKDAMAFHVEVARLLHGGRADVASPLRNVITATNRAGYTSFRSNGKPGRAAPATASKDGGRTRKPREPREPRDMSKVKCFRCRTLGHFASECPAVAPAPRDPSDNATSGKSDTSLYSQQTSYLTLSSHGKTIKASVLPDTGCTFTMTTAKVVKALDLETYAAPEVEIYDVQEERVHIQAATTLAIEWPTADGRTTTTDVEALVVEDMEFDVILGADFAVRYDALYDVARGEIVLRRHGTQDIRAPMGADEFEAIMDEKGKIALVLPDSAQASSRISQTDAFKNAFPTNLPDEIRNEIENLIDKYADIWSSNDTHRFTDLEEAHIELKPGARAVYIVSPARTEAEREWREAELQHRIKLGIFKELNHAPTWSTRVYIIKKKGKELERNKDGSAKAGAWRWIQDLSPVNRNSTKQHDRKLSLRRVLDRVGAHEYYMSLDFAGAFNSCRLAADSQELTAFTLDDGRSFVNTAMPMGEQNAPITWMRTLSKALGPLAAELAVWMDDGCGGKKTLPELIALTRRLFAAIRAAGLTLSPTKFRFGWHELEFVGMMVGRNGIRITDTQKTLFRDMRLPTTKQDINSFLCLVSYFAPFIARASDMTTMIRQGFRKGATFSWTPERLEAFEALKSAIADSPTLAHADALAEHEAIIYSDASIRGLGAVLGYTKDGEFTPITFSGRTLAAHERSLGVPDLELLAVVSALAKFAPYIDLRSITIYTDSTAVQGMLNAMLPTSNRRRDRWVSFIRSHHPKILHVSESENSAADAMSRLMHKMPETWNAAYVNEQHIINKRLKALASAATGTLTPITTLEEGNADTEPPSWLPIYATGGHEHDSPTDVELTLMPDEPHGIAAPTTTSTEASDARAARAARRHATRVAAEAAANEVERLEPEAAAVPTTLAAATSEDAPEAASVTESTTTSETTPATTSEAEPATTSEDAPATTSDDAPTTTSDDEPTTDHPTTSETSPMLTPATATEARARTLDEAEERDDIEPQHVQPQGNRQRSTHEYAAEAAERERVAALTRDYANPPRPFYWTPNDAPTLSDEDMELLLQIKTVHERAHTGRDATARLARTEGIDGPHLTALAALVCAGCVACCTMRPHAHAHGAPGAALAEHVTDALQLSSIDYAGPFGKVEGRSMRILVIVDVLTGLRTSQVVHTVGADNCISALEGYIAKIGTPKAIIADNAAVFKSNRIATWMATNGINFSICASRHHEGNGVAEAAIRALTHSLRTTKATDDKWSKSIAGWKAHVGLLDDTYNATPRIYGRGATAVTFSPAELTSPAHPTESGTEDEDTTTREEKIKLVIEARKEYASRPGASSRYETPTLALGTEVWFRNNEGGGRGSKLDRPIYQGPFTITAQRPGRGNNNAILSYEAKGAFRAWRGEPWHLNIRELKVGRTMHLARIIAEYKATEGALREAREERLDPASSTNPTSE
jgi:hypothetical protein